MHVDNSSAFVSRSPIQRWVWGAFAFLFVAIVVATVAFAPFPAQAGVKESIAEFISWVLSAIVSVLGKLLLVAVYLLTLIAQYNDFVNAAAVVNGWVIVRDVGNMFFIIVLLIIAFATILNVPNYQWKALLPKLVIAAILINFSKTIAGLLIDFSQVITLTFVNGFAAAAGGNFAQMYKIRELVTLNPAGGGGVDLLAILGGYFLAFVMLAIALTTTLIMAVIFAFRIVMLWALVVLSPLPYVLNILPQGKKYGDKWWSMFGEYLTVGPVLAFFLWLALVSVGSGEVSGFTGTGGAGASTAELSEYEASTSAVATEAGKPSSLISFVISISMLIAGLKITGEMGVIGAGAAKGALGKMEGMAKWGAKKFTGYRYASERVGAAWKMHENARQEKAQAGGAKLYGAYGTALTLPGKGLSLAGRGIGKGAGWVGKKTGLDGVAARAGNLPGVRHLQFEKRAKEAEAAASAARKGGDLEGAKKHDRTAYNWRAAQKWTRRGIAAGSVIMAPVTGGVSLVGLAPTAVRGMSKAGAAAQAAGKDYKFKAVKTALDAMKDMKPAEVQKKIDDNTAPNAERIAAFLKATQDGLLHSNEVAGGEGFLESLGADSKTKSTFRSYAEQGKYAGTMLGGKDDRAERQRRLAAGQISLKDIPESELTADGGSFAADIALHASSESQKELTKTPAGKAAYQKGLRDALETAKPEDKPKISAAMMRAGGTLAEAFGGDLDAFEAQLSGKGAGDLIAGLKPGDITGPLIERLARSADPAQLSQAVKKVSDEGQKEQAEALRGVIDQIRDQLTTATKPVADSQARVKTLQQSSSGGAREVSRLDGRVAQAAAGLRAATGTPQEAEMQTRLATAQGALDAERTRQEQITRDLEAEQRNLEDLKRQHAKEVKKLERLKGPKYNV